MRDKYLDKLKLFELLFDEIIRISNKTLGKYTDSWREEYGSHIFGKIACHTSSLLKLLPQSKSCSLSENLNISDINSICTLARALIDTYYVFYYLIIDDISQDEFEFRQLLWFYHDNTKAIELLNCCNKDDSIINELKETEIETANLHNNLDNCNFLNDLKSSPNYLSDKNLQNKVKKCLDGKVSIFIENGKLSTKIGISDKFYKRTYHYLSQYVHCYPFAVSQIAEFAKTNPKTYVIEIYVLNHLNCYLALAIRDFNKFYNIDYDDKIKKIIKICVKCMKNH